MSKAQKQLTQIKKQLPFASLPPPPAPPQLTETEQGKLADLQQSKADRRTLGKTYKRDRRAAFGAANMIRTGLAQATDELRAQGLEGPELTAAIKEFTSRQVDALAGARFQVQGLTTKFRTDRTQANADIAKGKAEKRSIFSNLRSQAAQDQAVYQQKVSAAGLKSQEAGLEAAVKAQSGGKGGMTATQRRALQNSRQSALIGVRAALKGAAPDDLAKIRENPEAFVSSAASHIEGASPVDVRWALRHILTKAKARQERGQPTIVPPNTFISP